MPLSRRKSPHFVDFFLVCAFFVGMGAGGARAQPADSPMGESAVDEPALALEEGLGLTPEQREASCLREQLLVAPASTTLEEMRRFCATEAYGDPSQRLERPVLPRCPSRNPRLLMDPQ